MAHFSYAAFTRTGARTSGSIEAENLTLALEMLQQRGLKPYATQPTQASRPNLSTHSRSARSLKWQASTCQKLATLLTAGIALDKAIHLLIAAEKAGKTKAFLNSVLEKVSAGLPLSQALSEGSLALLPDQAGVLQAAENSGHLARGLAELANQMQAKLDFRSAMVSAFLYPAFLVVLAPVSLLFIGLVLVPNLAPVFLDSGAPMPFVLASMLWIGQTAQTYWPVLSGLAILAILCAALMRNTLKLQLQSAATRLPGIRGVMRRLLLMRVTRLLGSLLSAGLSLQSALRHTRNALSSQQDKDAMQAAELAIANGAKLSSALASLRCFDASSKQMIAVGEETNNLGPLLLHIAQTEEANVKASIERLKVLLSPLLTIAMGLMIGSIVVSIMQAILSVNDLAIK